MADTGASYGSLARYTNIERIRELNERTMIAYSGELSDLQTIHRLLCDNELQTSFSDGITHNPEEIHSYLRSVMHNARNKVNPFLNQIVVGGVSDTNDLFLGYVDMYGTAYSDPYICTGFGSYMALPLLRKAYHENLSLEQAKEILQNAMRVLLYRHCRAINKFQFGVISRSGERSISEPFTISTNWNFRQFVDPTFQYTGVAANEQANCTGTM
uniref:Proteasome subunit beta type-4 n=1 Tax=Lygus hesperus TaxID=30085 RepID=A0A0A9WQY0_LYGHE